MSAEAFARFLEATGNRVLAAGGVHWYEAGRGFLLSLPTHQPLVPENDVFEQLFAAGGVYGVRFPAPLGGGGKLSYQIVCDDLEFGLNKLSGNVRSKVRRGLKRCEVRRVDFQEIAQLGADADRDTMARQGRDPKLVGDAWERYWSEAAATPGMEGWAAFVGQEMAAFLVTVSFSDGPVEFLLARSRSDLLNAYPNNALIYSCTEEMLCNRKVPKITFGLESLEPVGALDQFKFSMGFRNEEIRQRVVFHPWLRTALGSSTLRRIVHGFGDERGPDGGFWRKATGLLRFAEEGGDLGATP